MTHRGPKPSDPDLRVFTTDKKESPPEKPCHANLEGQTANKFL